MLDAASIIIQYHIFLALILVAAGLAGLAIRAFEKRGWVPHFLSTPEYIIIAALVIVYVFAQV